MAQSKEVLISDLPLGRLVWTPDTGSCLPGPPISQCPDLQGPVCSRVLRYISHGRQPTMGSDSNLNPALTLNLQNNLGQVVLQASDFLR